MQQFQEFRENWRALAAAFIGLSCGSTLTNYTLSLFGPELIRTFGWSPAEFALVGTLPLLTLLFIPLVGRFTDLLGARLAAAIGFVSIVLTLTALSAMDGTIQTYFAIMFAHFLLGAFTTPLVFCRVVVERFDRARGIALSIAMTGAPLTGAIAVPILAQIIAADGWRAAYWVLAIASSIGGLCSILLLPKKRVREEAEPAQPAAGSVDLPKLLRDSSLRLILLGIFLCNLPQVISSSQLKLILLWTGLADNAATWLLSLYAGGVIVGRFTTGLALDRVAAHRVAMIVLGLPAAGYVMMTSSSAVLPLLILAVLLIGLAQGGEGDIGAFLVSRRFGMENYSLILGFVTASLGAGTALGSLLFSLSLKLEADYAIFLIFAAVTTLLGAAAFHATGAFGGSVARPSSRSALGITEP